MVQTNEIFKSVRVISGFATVEIRDTQGDLIDVDAVDNAMYKFMTQSRSLHFEHSLPIGEILRWERRDKDGKDAVWIEAYLYDNEATKEIWQKIQNKEIHGFSIRGIAKERNNGKITELELYEISLVFQPANPQAILINAVEKSNSGSGKFIQILKSRLTIQRMNFTDVMKRRITIGPNELRNVWELHNDVIRSAFNESMEQTIQKLTSLKDTVARFSNVEPQTSLLINLIDNVVENLQSVKNEDEKVKKQVIMSILKIFGGAFNHWFIKIQSKTK
jgi:hypothetical protein